MKSKIDENKVKKQNLNEQQLYFNELLASQNKQFIVSGPEAEQAYSKWKRRQLKQFSKILQYDILNSNLTPEQKKAVTDIQRQFLHEIDINDLILKKGSMFCEQTSAEELEKLFHRAQQLMLLHGTTINDEYSVLIYSESESYEDLLARIESLCLSLDNKTDEIIASGTQLYESEDYERYNSFYNLNDEEMEVVKLGKLKSLEDAQQQFRELKAQFFSH
jgi:hypothetical protein